ncbi:Innexin, partial [Caligus rogercresseyi]
MTHRHIILPMGDLHDVVPSGNHAFTLQMWSFLEGGLIASFGPEGKASIILYDETKMEEESVVMDKPSFITTTSISYNSFAAKSSIISFSSSLLGHRHFPSGEVSLLWLECVSVLSYDKAERENNINPFCQTFPTEVSCTVPNIGAAGGEQFHNGLCVL